VARGGRVNVEVGVSLCCLQAAVTGLETPTLLSHWLKVSEREKRELWEGKEEGLVY